MTNIEQKSPESLDTIEPALNKLTEEEKKTVGEKVDAEVQAMHLQKLVENQDQRTAALHDILPKNLGRALDSEDRFNQAIKAELSTWPTNRKEDIPKAFPILSFIRGLTQDLTQSHGNFDTFKKAIASSYQKNGGSNESSIIQKTVPYLGWDKKNIGLIKESYPWSEIGTKQDSLNIAYSFKSLYNLLVWEKKKYYKESFESTLGDTGFGSNASNQLSGIAFDKRDIQTQAYLSTIFNKDSNILYSSEIGSLARLQDANKENLKKMDAKLSKNPTMPLHLKKNQNHLIIEKDSAGKRMANGSPIDSDTILEWSKNSTRSSFFHIEKTPWSNNSYELSYYGNTWTEDLPSPDLWGGIVDDEWANQYTE